MDIKQQFIDAAQFLRVLDPLADGFTFQIFDDREPKRSELAKVLHGSLEELMPILTYYNRQKAGIHVAVQETDLLGRRIPNIRNLRTIFADNDDTIDIAALPLPPSMIVESSPGNSHLYYLLDKKLSTSNGFKPDFDRIMKALIQRGSDKGAKDIAHTLRMPGFYNFKRDNPHYVRIKHIETDFFDDPLRYSWNELKENFRPVQKEKEDLNSFFESQPKQVITNPFRSALIASALLTIDPDCEHPKWLQIGASLHHESGGSQQGYDLFQSWSSEGSKYKDTEWPYQWDQFRNDKARCSKIASLYYIARNDYGWDGHYSLSVPDAEKLVQQERNNFFEYLNQYYGLIVVRDEVKLIYQVRNELRQADYQLLSKRGAATHFAPHKIPKINYSKKGNRNLIFESVFDRWIEKTNRNYYGGFCFEPSADIHLGDDLRVMVPGERYNTYLGLTNEGRDVPCDCIKRHILEVWCKGVKERYEYILNWLARMYQKPGVPAETMIVITSRHGAGKNIIFKHILESFGKYGKTDKSGESIVSNFNSVLMDAVFILVGEASFDTEAKQRAVINTLTTEDRIDVMKKFEDSREIKNCVHVVCFSNEEKPLRINIGDRKVYILSCNNKYVNNFDYFIELDRQITEEGAMDGFIHFLRTRNIDKFRPQIMPAAEKGLKSSLVLDDPKQIMSFLRTSLEEDNFFFTLGHNEVGYGLPNPKHILMDRLYLAYKVHCDDLRSMGKKVETASIIGFGRKLNEILGSTILKRRMPSPNEQGKREGFYQLSSLNEMRRAFDRYIGSPHDWGDDDEDDFDFLK